MTLTLDYYNVKCFSYFYNLRYSLNFLQKCPIKIVVNCIKIFKYKSLLKFKHRNLNTSDKIYRCKNFVTGVYDL